MPFGRSLSLGFTVRSLGVVGLFSGIVIACGTSNESEFPDGKKGTLDGGNDPGTFIGDPDAGLGADAFFTKDPPPQYCGPNPQDAPPVPGGTPECPDDKNVPGCPCTVVGEKKACWPGPRANRSLGICKDGETECKKVGEVGNQWGPCVGAVLPKPGVTKGKEACKCFSAGRWSIPNINICTRYSRDPNATSGPPITEADVSGADSTNFASSPPGACFPLNGTKSGPWSTNTLKVDCVGKFKLCYTVKAGDGENRKADDPVLTQQCTEAFYPEADKEMPFPDLGHWSAPVAAAKAYFARGGYGELSVIGESERCDKVDDGAGNPLVFQVLKYCQPKCSIPANKNLAEYQNCSNQIAGDF
jgi:hypothetical protein